MSGLMTRSHWTPAAILLLGLAASIGLRGDQTEVLSAPLASAVPRTLEHYASTELTVSDEELAVARPTAYLLRAYDDSTHPADSLAPSGFTVFVAFYDHQTQGQSIHSPKNCLPGAGWEPLTSSVTTVATSTGAVPVNRYLLQHGQEKALVLYWYQGRGRVAANEYLVKWQLLRDSALRHRSDEALVRIIVPLRGEDQTAAERLATAVAARLVPSLFQILPS